MLVNTRSSIIAESYDFINYEMVASLIKKNMYTKGKYGTMEYGTTYLWKYVNTENAHFNSPARCFQTTI